MASRKISLTLTHSKETKGTHVYKTPDADAFISSVYVKKDAFTSNRPDVITLSVEFEEE